MLIISFFICVEKLPIPSVSFAGHAADESEKIPLGLPQTGFEGGIFPDTILDMSKVSSEQASCVNQLDISGVPSNNQSDGEYGDSFSMLSF